MENLMKNKPLLIGISVIVVILVVVVGMKFAGKSTSSTQQTENVLPQTDTIKPVDASVIVTLKETTPGQEVTLTVDKIPEGTNTIEYELSYDATGPNGEVQPRGALASPIDVTGKKSIQRAITLGTCSSGKCVYDKGVKTIKAALKFNGTYGVRSFEKEYAL
jgi:predicted small secreted protein